MSAALSAFGVLAATHPPTDSTSTTEALLIGAVASIVASFVFLFAAPLLFRPHLKVSPQIAKMKNRKGNVVYRVKIVNKRMLSKAVNVRIEMAALRRVVGAHGGFKDEKDRIVTRPQTIDIMPRYKITEQWRPAKKRDAEYAYRFSTDEDLPTLLKPDTSSVRVRVYAEHPLTRAVRYFEVTYSQPTEVVTGDWDIGKSLEIGPTDNPPEPQPATGGESDGTPPNGQSDGTPTPNGETPPPNGHADGTPPGSS
jgi:hypothetical protein